MGSSGDGSDDLVPWLAHRNGADVDTRVNLSGLGGAGTDTLRAQDAGGGPASLRLPSVEAGSGIETIEASRIRVAAGAVLDFGDATLVQGMPIGGNVGNESINGSGGGNSVEGGDGADRHWGDDVLDGGKGNDVVAGGGDPSRGAQVDPRLVLVPQRHVGRRPRRGQASRGPPQPCWRVISPEGLMRLSEHPGRAGTSCGIDAAPWAGCPRQRDCRPPGRP